MPVAPGKGTYRVTMAADKENERKQITLAEFKLRAGAKLKARLLSGGGFVARFDKR